jgi:hypothetical protein
MVAVVEWAGWAEWAWICKETCGHPPAAFVPHQSQTARICGPFALEK